LLRLEHADQVVGRARLLAGLQGNPQLSVIGRVETQQVFIQNADVFNIILRQVQPVPDVAQVGRLVACDLNAAGAALNQPDIDNSLPDGLRRQKSAAGKIPLVRVNFI
jgi:hypothetical protein